MPRKNRTSTRRKLKTLYKRKGRTYKRKSSAHARTYKRMRGGYSQFGSNIPNTPSYSTGGILAAKNLGLANPVPYQALPCTTNCVDNYNYNTNKGFQV